MSFYLHDSYTLLLIFCISYFTLLHFFDKNRILLLLEYLANQKYAVIYHRQDTIIFQLFTSINIAIIFSILVSFYFSQFDTKISFITLLKIGALLFLFFITKALITHSLASIFEIIDDAKKYYYGYCSNLFMMATLFFPIILFMSYLNKGDYLHEYNVHLFYGSVIIYFLLKFILLKRLNALKIKFLFYIILYLCTLEALPYLALWKMLTTLI